MLEKDIVVYASGDRQTCKPIRWIEIDVAFLRIKDIIRLDRGARVSVLYICGT
jgi:hypothetical protein